jgi:hypothetical protein
MKVWPLEGCHRWALKAEISHSFMWHLLAEHLSYARLYLRSGEIAVAKADQSASSGGGNASELAVFWWIIVFWLDTTIVAMCKEESLSFRGTCWTVYRYHNVKCGLYFQITWVWGRWMNMWLRPDWLWIDGGFTGIYHTASVCIWNLPWWKCFKMHTELVPFLALFWLPHANNPSNLQIRPPRWALSPQLYKWEEPGLRFHTCPGSTDRGWQSPQPHDPALKLQEPPSLMSTIHSNEPAKRELPG